MVVYDLFNAAKGPIAGQSTPTHIFILNGPFLIALEYVKPLESHSVVLIYN